MADLLLTSVVVVLKTYYLGVVVPLITIAIRLLPYCLTLLDVYCLNASYGNGVYGIQWHSAIKSCQWQKLRNIFAIPPAHSYTQTHPPSPAK